MPTAKKTTPAASKTAIAKDAPVALAKVTKSDKTPKVINGDETVIVAKAGRRSAKAIAEVEQKIAKEERKREQKETSEIKETTKKVIVTKTRSVLERRAKAYRAKVSLIDQTKNYSLDEAAKLIGATNPVKFDSSVELHIRLGVDPRQAEQNIRDSVLLPAGSGRNLRVAVFVEGDDATAAKEAGADLIGEANVIKELEAGSFSFDVLIATPAQMPKLGKYARILGPRGLMPNPKSGTVTTNVRQAIKEAKSGKVEYRVDSGGNLHIPVGKVSFKPAQLIENLNAVIASVQSNKPATLKGAYILSSHLSTSMGPALRVAL